MPASFCYRGLAWPPGSQLAQGPMFSSPPALFPWTRLPLRTEPQKAAGIEPRPAPAFSLDANRDKVADGAHGPGTRGMGALGGGRALSHGAWAAFQGLEAAGGWGGEPRDGAAFPSSPQHRR